MTFNDLNIPLDIQNGLLELNIESPYPIQEEAIPVIVKGRDLCGIAKTGSGKTLCFVLPILMKTQEKVVLKNRHVHTLIVVPTRELAIQIQEVFTALEPTLSFPFKSLAVFGGVSINPQMKALQNVQVLIATPGRLIELSSSNAVHLDSVSMFVLDEADKLLNVGFKDEMDSILSLLPKKRQNILFSATLSPDVVSLQDSILTDPSIIKVELETASEDKVQINQTAYMVGEERKGPFLRYLIKENNMEQVLVFTSSSYKADRVAMKLVKNGIKARSIHGKKSQGNRTESLSLFKAKEIEVLVTTDLLSRGIDIKQLPYVINYELPRSPKDYIHRIGRTGRADQIGEAITFVTEIDEPHFYVIQKKMKKRVPLIETENIDLTKF